MDLKGARVLVTAGPTWVKIDPVRVISNTATGTTGALLADALARKGCRVTLLLGPSSAVKVPASVKVLRFRFFDELDGLLKQELRKSGYDVVVHAAAVSDFIPARAERRKISSSRKRLDLSFVAAPKLIMRLRAYGKKSVLVGFKYEPEAARRLLLRESRMLMQKAGLDAVVANTVRGGSYKAFIVGADAVSDCMKDKKTMVGSLVKFLQDHQVK